MKRVIVLLIIALPLVACSADRGDPFRASTPFPTATSPPTGTPGPAHTPVPTDTPVPTATPIPIEASISPNLEQARDEGFHRLAGHPPLAVDFAAAVSGGGGALSVTWDFDGDGTVDSQEIDPEPFVYPVSGEYTATLTVGDESGQRVQAQQRIVAIGEPDWPDWRYGVTAHLNRNAGLYASNAEVERAAQMIDALGIQVVRLDLAWSAIQPAGRDDYNWGHYDYLVALSTQHAFDLFPIIDYSAEWASSAQDVSDWQDWLFAAPSPTEYAWFAYQAVDRYKSHVRAWQVWNEPNSSLLWRPEPDPAVYAELLRQAYLAIKYADPEAVVVLAGLANDATDDLPQYVWYPPEAFLQAVYGAGGGDHFDAAARHPYTSPYEGTRRLLRKLNDFRGVMVDNGDAEKPIWITESGYPALPASAVTDGMQARWLAQSFDAMRSLYYVPVVFWYNFRETGEAPDDWEHHYGLIGHDWAVKPAYEAYRRYIADHP